MSIHLKPLFAEARETLVQEKKLCKWPNRVAIILDGPGFLQADDLSIAKQRIEYRLDLSVLYYKYEY